MTDQELDQMLSIWQAPAVPASIRAKLQSAIPDPPAPRIRGPRSRWILGLAFATGVLALGQSLATDSTLGSDGGHWSDGIFWHRTRIVHPALARLRWQAMGFANTGVQKEAGRLTGTKYLFDRLTGKRHGYTWSAEAAGGGQYLFSSRPVDGSADTKPLALTIRPGSAFDVDVYRSAGERVYDHYEITAQPFEESLAPAPSELVLSTPNLYVNGAFTAGPGGVVRAAGQFVLVDLPSRGHYTIALDPRGDSRFRPAGNAAGHTIEFQLEGDQFRIECSGPVVQGGTRPIFVYFQKDPAVRSPSFGAGAPGPAVAPLAFEVAAIKPADPNANGFLTRWISPRQVELRNASRRQLIEAAWDLRPYTLSAPAALESPNFDIMAKLPDSGKPANFRAMLQSLLTERFQLQFHHEECVLPGFALVVAKGGPKLQASAADTVMSTSYGQAMVKCRGITLVQFTEQLSRSLNRPVQDATSIQGVYDMEVHWALDDDTSGLTVFAALQEKLGLKLEAQKVPVTVLVVDRMNRVPTEE